MKAIQLHTYGDPLTSVKAVDLPEPGLPKAGEVLINVEYSPVNPSDTLLIMGMYALRPELPAVIGGEGCGLIIAIGDGVTNVKVGDRVTIPYGTFAWAEKIIAPAVNLFVVPEEVDAQQASMLSINPVSSILLLEDYVDLKSGDWVVLNAANSSVARGIIAVAKSKGIKTLGIVRRPEAVLAAQEAGADAVIVEGADIADQATAATGGADIKLGLDAVGGESSDMLITLLGVDSQLVSYGLISGKPMMIGQVGLIFKRITVKGFWLYLPQFLPKFHKPLVESARLSALGALTVPVAAVYSPDQITEAIAHAQNGGKVLLDFRNSSK